ncbi:MAG: adenylate kinase [Thermoplasmata archaeon]
MGAEPRRDAPERMVAYAVIFLGAPGAGKGTQAREMSARFGVPQISTGDMLREAIAGHSPLAWAIKARMEAGELVTDEVVCDLVEERIGRPDGANGFILDGFPRTLKQADFVDRLLADQGHGAPLALNIVVDQEVLLKRLTGRRTCPVCGRIYNMYFNPPLADEVCDVDGARLVQRADDQEAAIRQRLVAYDGETKPLIEHYRERQLLRDVNGNGDREAIAEELARILRGA